MRCSQVYTKASDLSRKPISQLLDAQNAEGKGTRNVSITTSRGTLMHHGRPSARNTRRKSEVRQHKILCQCSTAIKEGSPREIFSLRRSYTTYSRSPPSIVGRDRSRFLPDGRHDTFNAPSRNVPPREVIYHAPHCGRKGSL